MDLPPAVDLSGNGHPDSVTLIAAGLQRIYSRAERAWIHAEASDRSRRLGYLRAGASSPVRGEPQPGSGCSKAWYPILPEGFVCLNHRATLDVNDPIVAALREYPPDFQRKLPYIYGTVRKPGPFYARLPTRRELGKSEPGHQDRMKRWLTIGGEIGASYAQHVWLGVPGEPRDPAQAWETNHTEDVPWFLQDGGMAPNLRGVPRDPDQLVLGKMDSKVGHALVDTFFWEGRRYGVTTDLTILPTDRLRPIQGSDYHGVEIGKDVSFPFAIVRRVDARFYDGERAKYREVLKLTGKQRFYDEILHYETEDGKWISDRYASRVRPARKMPKWANDGERWVDISLTKQLMLLYDGTEPVYATLISSGEAGLEDPDSTTATKRGIFRIHTKHVTATMSSREIGEEFELNDVPYVQYFDKEGYAIHGAYWHDRFGRPKSHGCINLSPEDARRLFFWTNPSVPPGWHAALDTRGTVVFIHP